MAKISTIKGCIKLCREAGITLFIWGHRGLGKSSLVQQECAVNNMGFIDLRCSQLEASDIRGLPDRGTDGRTHYLPPADMPVGDLTNEEIVKLLGPTPDLNGNDLEADRNYTLKLMDMQRRFQRGILFIDEVNRAQDDVLQAIFQLVLDRKVGQYVLPPGWSIVAAGNFSEGGSYQVSGFNDAAFLNRFSHVTLSAGESTLEEWVDYMSQCHEGDAADVVEFASQNMKHLDGEISGELGFGIQPSRRSWEMVVRVSKAFKAGKYQEDTYLEVLSGLIGRELAISFHRYNCPVKPSQLLRDGIAAHSGALKNLGRQQLSGLMWGLVSHAKSKVDTDANVANVCLDFADLLLKQANDKDVVVAFCRALVSGSSPGDSQSKARAAMISNPKLAQMVAKFSKKDPTNKTKTFIERLTDRPSLQDALSRVAWGTDDSEK